LEDVRFDAEGWEIPLVADEPVAPGAAIDDMMGPSMLRTCWSDRRVCTSLMFRT